MILIEPRPFQPHFEFREPIVMSRQVFETLPVVRRDGVEVNPTGAQMRVEIERCGKPCWHLVEVELTPLGFRYPARKIEIVTAHHVED